MLIVVEEVATNVINNQGSLLMPVNQAVAWWCCTAQPCPADLCKVTHWLAMVCGCELRVIPPHIWLILSSHECRCRNGCHAIQPPRPCRGVVQLFLWDLEAPHLPRSRRGKRAMLVRVHWNRPISQCALNRTHVTLNSTDRLCSLCWSLGSNPRTKRSCFSACWMRVCFCRMPTDAGDRFTGTLTPRFKEPLGTGKKVP